MISFLGAVDNGNTFLSGQGVTSGLSEISLMSEIVEEGTSGTLGTSGTSEAPILETII
jgi:hypothetical protein